MSSASGDGKAREAWGGGRPTINDIARVANVSKKTVSRVINNSPFVRGETRERIQAAIREHGYAPDPQARGLSLRRSFLIGLVIDNPDPRYLVDIQLGLLDGLRNSGFDLVLHSGDRAAPEFLEDLQSFVQRRRLQGVVLIPPLSEDVNVTRLLRRLGCPYARIAQAELDTPEQALATGDWPASRAGLESPHERSIAGFGDDPVAAPRQFGRLAAMRLMAQMDETDLDGDAAPARPVERAPSGRSPS